MTFNLGGLTRASESGSVPNTVDMNIYSDEGCFYAEHILPYGRELTVVYSQDYVEMWDGTDYIIHSIQPTARPANSDTKVEPKTPPTPSADNDVKKQMEELKREIEELKKQKSGKNN